MRSRLLLFAASLLIAFEVVQGIGHDACVASTKSSAFSFPLVANGKAATLLVGSNDWPGVQRAAQDFSSDVGKVTGHALTVLNATSSLTVAKGSSPVIIVGTLGHSALIDAVLLASNGSASDISALQGQWEAYSAKLVTLPGVGSAYVIVGSDKRGAIYGLYELSEQVRAVLRF